MALDALWSEAKKENPQKNRRTLSEEWFNATGKRIVMDSDNLPPRKWADGKMHEKVDGTWKEVKESEEKSQSSEAEDINKDIVSTINSFSVKNAKFPITTILNKTRSLLRAKGYDIGKTNSVKEDSKTEYGFAYPMKKGGDDYEVKIYSPEKIEIWKNGKLETTTKQEKQTAPKGEKNPKQENTTKPEQQTSPEVEKKPKPKKEVPIRKAMVQKMSKNPKTDKNLVMSFDRATKDSFFKYGGGGFSDINDFLRHEDKSKVSLETKKEIERITKGIEKSSLPKMTLKRRSDYRWISAMTGNDEWIDNLKSLEGKTLTDKAFISTTQDPYYDHGKGRNIVTYFNVPKGAKGIDIEGIAPSKYEREVLLQRNTSFKILKAEEDGDDIVIEADILPKEEKQ